MVWITWLYVNEITIIEYVNEWLHLRIRKIMKIKRYESFYGIRIDWIIGDVQYHVSMI